MLYYVSTPCMFEACCSSSSTPTSTCTVVEKIWCVDIKEHSVVTEICII